MVQTNLRAPVELSKKLEQEAKRRNMSLNALTVSILDRHVEESHRVVVRSGQRVP